MKSKRINDRELCAESHPDDGVPPHVLAKRGRPRGSARAGRHHLDQLCKQVRIALGEALVCDCSDSVLQSLVVESVKPLTGSSVLQVTLTLPSADPGQFEHAHQQLQRASGILRSAVASAIHRKRVPQLRFCVVGA